MSNPPHDPKRFSRLRRIQQITENHCGPAVIQMLLENVGVSASQEEITVAAQAHAAVARALNGRAVQSVIVAPGRLVNFLTKG